MRIKDFFIDTFKFLVVPIVFVCVSFTAITYIYEIGSEQVEQYCYVENKHTERRLVGQIFTTRHYIDVYVEDAEELKDSITVPGSFYNEVEIGDEIKCVLYYKGDKLVKIEVAE